MAGLDGLLFFDRVRETAASPGTGNVTPLGAITGYRRFSDVLSDGQKTVLLIQDQAGSRWEVSIVTFNSSGQLVRTDAGVIAGSSGPGTRVNFNTSTQDIWIDFPAAVATAAAFGYLHQQGSPASVWTVAHNLGKYPAVDVIDSSGNKVYGAVNYVDLNNLTISFNASFSGKASCT